MFCAVARHSPSFRVAWNPGHDDQTNDDQTHDHLNPPQGGGLQEAAFSLYLYQFTSLESVTCITGEGDIRFKVALSKVTLTAEQDFETGGAAGSLAKIAATSSPTELKNPIMASEQPLVPGPAGGVVRTECC